LRAVVVVAGWCGLLLCRIAASIPNESGAAQGTVLKKGNITTLDHRRKDFRSCSFQDLRNISGKKKAGWEKCSDCSGRPFPSLVNAHLLGALGHYLENRLLTTLQPPALGCQRAPVDPHDGGALEQRQDQVQR
jgi:hypothetical protein